MAITTETYDRSSLRTLFIMAIMRLLLAVCFEIQSTLLRKTRAKAIVYNPEKLGRLLR